MAERTIIFNQPDLWRGESIQTFQVRINNPDASPLVPVGVCGQILDRFNDEVYRYTPHINIADGTVTFDKVEADWSKGTYTLDVWYLFGSGDRRKYVTGSVTVKGEKPC